MMWTPESVAERFEECVWVLDHLPSESGRAYANGWPEIIYTPQEIKRQPPKPLRLRPLPDAIDRMEETLRWMQWVAESDRPVLWHKARGDSWREIARQTGIPPTTARRYWLRGLRVVAGHLVSLRVIADS